MVRIWGIYGVLLSTVFSMLFVGMPWLFYNLFTTIFERELLLDYLKKLFKLSMVSFVVCVVSVGLCNIINIGLFQTIIIRLGMCLIVPNVMFCMIYYRTVEYRESLFLMNTITKGKFIKILRKLGEIDG